MRALGHAVDENVAKALDRVMQTGLLAVALNNDTARLASGKVFCVQLCDPKFASTNK